MIAIVETMREDDFSPTKLSIKGITPKMFGDAKEYVNKYPQCQRFASSSNRPSVDLHTLRSP